jgi:type I restriction enzyme S subunit
LFYWFRLPSILHQVEADCEGSTPLTRNRYKEKYFLSLEIPLPPLDEQRRIVGRIEGLAAKIEEAQRLRGETAVAIDALVASVEHGIWPDEALEDAPLLDELTVHLARGKQSKQGESEHFLVKTRHVQMDQYVESEMTLAPHIAEKVNPNDLLQFRDIMIACSARGSLGRVARYDLEGQLASTDTHVAIARPDEDRILGDYLYSYLKGAQGQHQLISRERGDWSKQKTSFRLAELNLRDLRSVPVPLPSKEEQQRIVDYLAGLYAKVDALRAHQTATQRDLDALLPAILDKAFKGEL